MRSSCSCSKMGELGSERLDDVPGVRQLIRALERQAEARPAGFSNIWRGCFNDTFFFSILSISLQLPVSGSSNTCQFPFTAKRVRSSRGKEQCQVRFSCQRFISIVFIVEDTVYWRPLILVPIIFNNTKLSVKNILTCLKRVTLKEKY